MKYCEKKTKKQYFKSMLKTKAYMCTGRGGAARRNAVESDAGADRNTRDAIPERHENSEHTANRADHSATRQIRQDRRQKRVLLVSKP